VRFGNAREPEGTKEIPARTRLKGSRCPTSMPSSSIRSAFAVIEEEPAIEISVLVLPDPLRPRSVTILPWSTSRSRSKMTWLLP
jgi:hypothetical protein